ncbi:isoprenylcysteine carboxyl methyltransferase (icmt) family protein [Cardiosporidium cionae]|uniref:Isoprenylcysteine carboxyl methyltransferase (Icmt) family protein n=1 Tax=Cardiosporidium cionae TaxID=476202 RepID=A0ABQ7JBH2_9APIC|nr:isoprenylcysteine carboxyl methyltransferase (icmt) family protein [Cardiosporidium cionae]|eukprot:KAF8821336.1 isoprenylcysteine carboxyl methyltransferase (icmt) family protein [Cardiosporidium cionae]
MRGSQVLLLNPCSFFLFSFLCLKFFRQRIDFEDALLLDFFGDVFLQYIIRTPYSGIPGL